MVLDIRDTLDSKTDQWFATFSRIPSEIKKKKNYEPLRANSYIFRSH